MPNIAWWAAVADRPNATRSPYPDSASGETWIMLKPAYCRARSKQHKHPRSRGRDWAPASEPKFARFLALSPRTLIAVAAFNLGLDVDTFNSTELSASTSSRLFVVDVAFVDSLPLSLRATEGGVDITGFGSCRKLVEMFGPPVSDAAVPWGRFAPSGPAVVDRL